MVRPLVGNIVKWVGAKDNLLTFSQGCNLATSLNWQTRRVEHFPPSAGTWGAKQYCICKKKRPGMPENFDDYIKESMVKSMQNAGISNIPEQVMAASKAHTVKLATLVVSLRAAGVDEQMVRHSISEVLKSYEEELLNALLALSKGDQK